MSLTKARASARSSSLERVSEGQSQAWRVSVERGVQLESQRTNETQNDGIMTEVADAVP